jgi:hypothetical protein
MTTEEVYQEVHKLVAIVSSVESSTEEMAIQARETTTSLCNFMATATLKLLEIERRVAMLERRN